MAYLIFYRTTLIDGAAALGTSINSDVLAPGLQVQYQGFINANSSTFGIINVVASNVLLNVNNAFL